MVKVTFVNHDGTETVVDATTGASLMEAAVRNGVRGIEADCGGACACATCQVYVDPEWFDKLGKPGDTEGEMLEFAVERQPNSRLSCQIKVTEGLDGLIVRLPVSQH